MAATLIGFTGFALRAEPPELAALAPQGGVLFAQLGGASEREC